MMEPQRESLQNYIKSGEYFRDAMIWYRLKYINPLSHRSFVFLATMIVCALFTGCIIHIYSLFPVVIKVQYSVDIGSNSNKIVQIIEPEDESIESTSFITGILIKNYVIARESYSYDNLRNQFIFLQNSSTRIAFRKFYNLMNIDNPHSPVMRYQKNIIVSPTIVSINYPDDTRAVVKFNSIAKDGAGNITENVLREATIDYEIDKVNPNRAPGSRFNFTVTDYRLKLI